MFAEMLVVEAQQATKTDAAAQAGINTANLSTQLK
jgi:hypothetical protein